ncbi:MAG: glycosyltransferase family 39 protein [Aggregatilineales bacterium]
MSVNDNTTKKGELAGRPYGDNGNVEGIGRLYKNHAYIVPILLILVLLIAFGVRFHLLGAQSLWHDEGNSYVQATRSLSAIADNAARDIHPPGYYWLLSLWRQLTGDSEFALRALSAFASVLSIAFTYALGKRLIGVWAGLAAGLFVALNTFSIYYAQEARMYALLAMWASASMWVFAELILNTHRNNPSRRHYLTYALLLAIINAAGLYTQYAFPFVMVAQGILFLLWLWSLFSNGRASDNEGDLAGRPYKSMLQLLGWYVAANVLTIVLYSPWMGTAWEQLTNWPNTGETIPFAQALSQIIAWFSFGITHQAGVTVTIAFFLLFGLLDFNDAPDTKRTWWRILVPVVWLSVSVGIFVALGLFREANLKFLLPAQIAFSLWLARGMWVLWTVRVKRQNIGILRFAPKAAALLGVFVILSGLVEGLNPLYTDPAFQRDNYRAIVAEINANARGNDAIILSAPNQQEVFEYYYSGNATIYPLPRGLGGDDRATRTEMLSIIGQHRSIYAVLWGTGERDPNNIVESTLDGEAFEASSEWFGDVRLVRYATPVEFTDVQQLEETITFGNHITLESYALSTEDLRVGDVLQVQLQWSTDAPLDTRYKVFLQILDADGFLVAQRDAEPVGGTRPTTSWDTGNRITDNHAVIIPNGLPSANYKLIIGLYDIDNPNARLPVNGDDNLELGELTIR